MTIDGLYRAVQKRYFSFDFLFDLLTINETSREGEKRPLIC